MNVWVLLLSKQDLKSPGLGERPPGSWEQKSTEDTRKCLCKWLQWTPPHTRGTFWAPEPSPEGGHPNLGEEAQSCDPTSRSGVRSGAGQDKDAPFCCPCTASCLQINGIIQFPGLLTFSLGINCDHPNKYRQITLKTYIYEAHLFKTFSSAEKYLYLTKRGKKKNTSSVQSCTHPFLSPLAADAGVWFSVALMTSCPTSNRSKVKETFFFFFPLYSKLAERGWDVWADRNVVPGMFEQ